MIVPQGERQVHSFSQKGQKYELKTPQKHKIILTSLATRPFQISLAGLKAF